MKVRDAEGLVVLGAHPHPLHWPRSGSHGNPFCDKDEADHLLLRHPPIGPYLRIPAEVPSWLSRGKKSGSENLENAEHS